MAWHKQVCRNWLVQARRLLSTVSLASSLRALHSTTRFWPHPQHRDAEAGRECTTSSEQSYKRYEKEGEPLRGLRHQPHHLKHRLKLSRLAHVACTASRYAKPLSHQRSLSHTFSHNHRGGAILAQHKDFMHAQLPYTGHPMVIGQAGQCTKLLLAL